jgi:hypothetical protein
MDKEIPIEGGRIAVVDAEDYPVLIRFHWLWDRYPYVLIRGTKFYMHEFLMIRTKELTRMVVDHIDTNTLNNRKRNFRWATKSQNAQNQKREFIGISYDKRRHKWRAYHTLDGVWHNLGYHDTDLQAKQAYNDFVTTHRAGHVKTN